MHRGVFAAGLLALALLGATPSPTPSTAPASPSPSPSASPAPRNGIGVAFDLASTFVSQATGGPGTTPLGAPEYINGTAPAAPNTPYDALSLVAQTPGNAGVTQGTLTTSYRTNGLVANVVMGAGWVVGSSTNAAYWAEPLMPTMNPHLGFNAINYQLSYATHAGQDDTAAFRASVLSAEAAAPDSSWDLRAGWFDLLQTNRFVFAAPAITSIIPGLQPTTQESLVAAPPALASWSDASQSLPLDGVDLVLRRGIATAEITNAALPAPPGIGAQLTQASLTVDHGEGTQWSAQLAHIVTGGAPLATSTLYGASAGVVESNQGLLPSSYLSAQQQTTMGLRGAFHVSPAIDGFAEVAQSDFDDQAMAGGTVQTTAGDYVHVGASYKYKRLTAELEWYRFGTTYAPLGMQYGANENYWSSAWGWPAFAFETGYQTVDNSVISNDRQGPLARLNLDGGPLQFHIIASDFQQLTPYAPALYGQTGFTESKFPPQAGSGTLGRIEQGAAWVDWQTNVVEIILDEVDDRMERPPSPGFPIDAFRMNVPQTVLTFAKHFTPTLVATAGAASFSQHGSWAVVGTNNIDFTQTTLFGGAQYQWTPHLASMVEVHRFSFAGAPYVAGGPSQNYAGWLVIFEQRFLANQ